MSDADKRQTRQRLLTIVACACVFALGGPANLGAGLARLGHFRGDGFVAAAVVLSAALLALFVALPVAKALVGALQDEAGSGDPCAYGAGYLDARWLTTQQRDGLVTVARAGALRSSGACRTVHERPGPGLFRRPRDYAARRPAACSSAGTLCMCP